MFQNWNLFYEFDNIEPTLESESGGEPLLPYDLESGLYSRSVHLIVLSFLEIIILLSFLENLIKILQKMNGSDIDEGEEYHL